MSAFAARLSGLPLISTGRLIRTVKPLSSKSCSLTVFESGHVGLTRYLWISAVPSYSPIQNLGSERGHIFSRGGSATELSLAGMVGLNTGVASDTPCAGPGCRVSEGEISARTALCQVGSESVAMSDPSRSPSGRVRERISPGSTFKRDAVPIRLSSTRTWREGSVIARTANASENATSGATQSPGNLRDSVRSKR